MFIWRALFSCNTRSEIRRFEIRPFALLPTNYSYPFRVNVTIYLNAVQYSAQKMKFSINDFLSICHQIRGFLRIWSHLLRKSLMENFVFCAVSILQQER